MSLEQTLLNGTQTTLGFNGNQGPQFDYPLMNSPIHYQFSTIGNPTFGALHPTLGTFGNFAQSVFNISPAVLDGNPTSELSPDQGPYNPQPGNGYIGSNLPGAFW